MKTLLVVATISCRFWLYMGPVVATFYLTNWFLATDRMSKWNQKTWVYSSYLYRKAMNQFLFRNTESYLSKDDTQFTDLERRCYL